MKILTLEKSKKFGNHFVLDNEYFIDPKLMPFSELSKKAELENLDYNFEDEILTVFFPKYIYKLFWCEMFPDEISKINFE